MTESPYAGFVRAVLRNAATQVLALDPDLARDLADLAADYAGPYTEQETTNG
jgi:hypothetical protein